MVQPPLKQKTVAVVGGGPAGMAAAMYLRARGHAVDLYEQSDSLGGQMRTALCPTFKWPLKRFLARMEEITRSEGTNVQLNTPAPLSYWRKRGMML